MPYVVARPEGAKRADLYVVKRTPHGLQGMVADHTRFTAEAVVVRIRDADILAPLGDDPPYGRVYGVLVEPVRNRWDLRGWGSIYNHVPKMSTDMRERLQATLLQSKRLIERQFPGCTNGDMLTFVRHNQGACIGTYAYKPRGVDEYTLRPPATMGKREFVKVQTHELAHRAWYRTLTPEQRVTWIDLFSRFVQVQQVTVGDVKKMVRSLRQIESLRDYLRECDPEEQAAMTIYMGWLGKVHRMSKNVLQDLVSAGCSPPLPDVHLHRSDVDTPVTLYSKTNPEELFCEAVSSHMVGDLQDRTMLRMLSGRAR